MMRIFLPPSLYVMSDDQYLSNSINDFYENQLKNGNDPWF